MSIAQSKLTAQGQISVPVEIRKKLGVGPGSILEWHEQDDRIVVRRAGRFTSSDLHRALFPAGSGSVDGAPGIKDGISKSIRKRHAGR